MPSRTKLWTGRILSGLVVAFLVFDGAIKLVAIQPVADAMTHLGYPVSLAITIGVLELACTALYVTPRTSVLGAIALTAFLGGATATHVRIGDPFYFPVVLGLLMWAGLLLREDRLTTLVPARAPRLAI